MPKLPLTITDTKAHIARLIPGGQGIATFAQDSAKSAMVKGGKKAFFWNALPGETVTEFTIIKNKSHYLEAIATKLDNLSAERLAPKDTCYLATSPWQIMNYDYELAQKSQLLVEVFRQADLKDDIIKTPLANTPGTTTPDTSTSDPSQSPIPQVITDNKDFYYRNKMEYSLYWSQETGQIQLAQHQRGSHRKIPLETSSIERPEIFAAATEIIADLNARGEEARKYQSLLLRCDQQGRISGGLYENYKPHPVFDNLNDQLLGRSYSYSPNGFFQINLPVYEVALREIQQHLGSSSEILDLYAGVGSIGLSVASDRKLTLVECNAAAFAELQKNCAKLPYAPLPILSNSEDALEFINEHQTVILDPPRAGCHAKLLARLLEVLPPTIIYLSCNPTTQARDLKILLEKYHLELIKPYNFFPRTPHLENLVVLQKKP